MTNLQKLIDLTPRELKLLLLNYRHFPKDYSPEQVNDLRTAFIAKGYRLEKKQGEIVAVKNMKRSTPC